MKIAHRPSGDNGRETGHFSNLKQIKKLICWLFFAKPTSPLESCVFCIMKLKSWNRCSPPSSLFVGISMGSHLTWGCSFFLLLWLGFNSIISLPVLKICMRPLTAGRMKSKALMGLVRPWDLSTSCTSSFLVWKCVRVFDSCHFPHLRAFAHATSQPFSPGQSFSSFRAGLLFFSSLKEVFISEALNSGSYFKL